MRCPLLSKDVKVSKEVVTLGLVDCLKEECAWWEAELGECAVASFLLDAHCIVSELIALKKKMPHEEQFRK